MKLTHLLFAITLVIIAGTGCRKKKIDSPTPPTTADPGVYSVGIVRTGANFIATFWKNDEEHQLTDGQYNAHAEAIEISGKDIYIAGREFNGQQNSSGVRQAVAKYWKNGTEVILTDGTQNSWAKAIKVYGKDVYVSGFITVDNKRVAAYWKNGTLVEIGNKDAGESEATGIAVSGSDVYVSGTKTIYSPAFAIKAVLWKNGVETILTSGAGGSMEFATDVKVSGNDVHVCGFSDNPNGENIAMYWKNGVATRLTDGVKHASAMAMAVKENDVYIAITESTLTNNSDAKYWKNGQITTLSNGTSLASAECLDVNNGNVYVGGHLFNASGTIYTAKYWNGSGVFDVGTTEGRLSKVLDIKVIQ